MTTRRLAAILAADAVGFSRLVGANEAGTLSRMRALRHEVIDPLMAEHGGRIFKTTGDGLLAEFSSAVQALRCAIAIQERQRAITDALQIRIGLHTGDVVVEGDDLLGDGVNIAARIEPLAEPGGICISALVREDAAGKIFLEVEDLGEHELKNIARKIRLFRVRLGSEPAQSLALPDKPSLAVLPFQNMSGDPEQEYFADGMVEGITTALSRIGGLFVIARNSSFTHKGRAVDMRQVGRELGVRYVLEGSVRKAGGRLRITCQLINAATGAHVWADRFDSTLEDIFDLQDRVTESVAGAIEPTLRNLETERAANKPTESQDAYDLYLRALSHYDQFTRRDLDEGVRLLRRAMSLDPRFALAKALTAFLLGHMVNRGWCPADGAEAAEAVELARSALAMARDDPTAQGMAGNVVATLGRDVNVARAALERAIALNPNAAHVLGWSAWNRMYEEDWSLAQDEFVRGMRLSPLASDKFFNLAGLSIAVGELGRLEEAVDLMHKSFAAARGAIFGRSTMLHHLVRLNRMDQARALVQVFLEEDPEFTLAVARRRFHGYSAAFMERRIAALRAAGIPE